MKLIKRDPKYGYLDCNLWVPKSLLNVEGVKRALEFELPARDTVKVLSLWQEAEHHLIVPRAFWKPGELGFDCVDCRPTSFVKTDVVSKVRLNHRPMAGKLVPTGDTIQSDAIAALKAATGGTLQLACVSGDTIVQLNRGGKGFKCAIADAFKRSTTEGRYAWDPSIPTYIRAKQGDRVGLQLVKQFIKKGKRQTITLELEDGKRLRLTDDHQVLTDNGFRSIREGLTVGDLVFVDGKRTESTRKEKTAYRRIGGFNNHPFARYQSRSYVIEEHQAVAEAALNKMTLPAFKWRCGPNGYIDRLKFIDPAKYHVHHIDENPKNNAISNLEVLEIEQHLQQHKPGAVAFGQGVPQLVRIKSLTKGKLEEVYDVVCADPHHNFVADGIVVHNCGKGKTVVALHLAAEMQVPTVIAVDNTHLLEQWLEETKRHLVVPGGVGLIQGSTRDWQKSIVMATYQSLANWSETMPEEVRRWFGLVIWDEGHHVNAPTFSKSAPLFYGYRLALTATPFRNDGLHVVAQHHIGDIIFKDVIQASPPKIYFKWTGFELDFTDEKIRSAVCDKNGEVHLGKVAGYFGSSRERMTQIVLPEVQRLVNDGHKIIVLSNSVDEVINLHALWTTADANYPLYTDIPYPTAADVGETLQPHELAKDQVVRAERFIAEVTKNLARNPNMQKAKREVAEERLRKYEELLAQFEVWKKTEKEMRRRQRVYLKELLAMPSSSGIFTEAVEPKERFHMLKTRQVIFAIMKYGREGLDDKDLSAVLVSEPISDRNTLQQIMGRPRNKSNSVLIFLEDSVGPLVGQCKKLRFHLRDWPVDEGGPFKYEHIDHPSLQRRQGNSWSKQLRRPALRAPGS